MGNATNYQFPRQIGEVVYDSINNVPSLIPSKLLKFVPDKGLTWINWDYPRYVHTGVNVDYKMTGYDWSDRTLVWSIPIAPSTVNPISIDSSGKISWLPDATEDQQDFAITIRMVAGSTTVDKSVIIKVNNSRCTFCDWATGTDDSAGTRGQISNPYKSVDHAMSEDVVSGTGRTIYIRGGTSNEFVDYLASGPNDGKTFSANEPLLVRNYPGETVTNDCLNSGHTYFPSRGTVSGYCVTYGLNAVNQDQRGMEANSDSVIKLCTSRTTRVVFNNNPRSFTGYGGTVFDSCVGGDSYDVASPNVNSQDFYLLMDSGLQKDAYCIDCESEGATSASITTLSGFRAKHQGNAWDATNNIPEATIHYHRCSASNWKFSASPFVLGVGDTLRHSVSVSDKFCLNATQTQEGIGWPTETFPKEVLVQKCLLALRSSGTQIMGNSFNGFATRFKFYNNEIDFTNGTMGSHAGTTNNYEGFEYLDNELYGPSSTNILTVTGDLFSLSDMNVAVNDTDVAASDTNDKVGGSGNTREVFSANLVKTCAGKTWTWDGSDLVGV